MSTHPITHDGQSGHDATHSHPAPVEPKATLPTWLIVAFGITLVAGAVLILGRAHFAENSLYDSMTTCDAFVKPDIGERGESGKFESVRPNGLGDGYALIRIRKERESIASLVALCDRDDPIAGRRLFRKALDTGNKSAKIVALHCANYLAHSQTTPAPRADIGVLESEDFDRLLAKLDSTKEIDADVRKAALRAMSDLVIITNSAAVTAFTADSKAETRYTVVTDAVREATMKTLDADAKESGDVEKETRDKRRDIKIVLHSDTLNGKPVLLIRWSTPGLALAWWKENVKEGAKWDNALQRFVFP
ncbi:MAG: hypothetical protein WCT04_21935 [Planctomycetota bacterium]